MSSSTTSYAPWDAGAPPLFKRTQMNNSIDLAFFALLVYDHLITLDKEIEWIWTLRWRLPKVLFIANRYVITSLLFVEYIPTYLFPVSLSVCIPCPRDVMRSLTGRLISVLQILCRRRILNTDIQFVYRRASNHLADDNRKLLAWFLRGILLVALIGAVVVAVSIIRTYLTVLAYNLLPGCWRFSRVIFLTLEGVYMLLTAYKLFSNRKTLNRTITLLARDSILYFTLVFASMVVNLTADRDSNFPVRFTGPTQCITSIAVGRMMMNIRGLILDDPQHTVHLQTLQFGGRTTAASEIEDVY
ncbi:hypothetical protein PILCRDRAFT_16333 [Piloderma croceum F 1598]|uniref:DUF6533 domain-containing protein n=1 Tax=Piloderma croceum (strain F 1598) TaxID=765440 RepID=A0A0C3B4K4_PILCF|nr:hypothetical protein PILCRDRAFT_16333 [Piloderma croceum F 1598]